MADTLLKSSQPQKRDNDISKSSYVEKNMNKSDFAVSTSNLVVIKQSDSFWRVLRYWCSLIFIG